MRGRYIRTITVRPRILLALLGMGIGVITFSHPMDAAGQASGPSTLTGAGVVSGGETSFDPKSSAERLSPGDPLRYMLIGLGLLVVATFRRRKFKGPSQAGRNGLLRPAGTLAKPASGPGECAWFDIPAADPQPSRGLPQTSVSVDPYVACAAHISGLQGAAADSSQAVENRMTL